MITVQVDGRPFTADISRLRSMGDLIELIKATIDPDSIITSLTLSGAQLSESDWRMPLSVHGDKALQVTTGDKAQYIAERLASAESYLRSIVGQFAEIAGYYKTGQADQGNRKLGKGVQDLLAFLNWYSSILQMEEKRRQTENEYNEYIRQIKAICDQVIQQQMFQSWYMVADALENKLNPELERLSQFCRAVR